MSRLVHTLLILALIVLAGAIVNAILAMAVGTRSANLSMTNDQVEAAVLDCIASHGAPEIVRHGRLKLIGEVLCWGAK